MLATLATCTHCNTATSLSTDEFLLTFYLLLECILKEQLSVILVHVTHLHDPRNYLYDQRRRNRQLGKETIASPG